MYSSDYHTETDFQKEVESSLLTSDSHFPDVQLHRFRAAVTFEDVKFDIKDKKYVLPPTPKELRKDVKGQRFAIPQDPLKEEVEQERREEIIAVVGVHFFVPFHHLFKPVYAFLKRKDDTKKCFLTSSHQMLDDKLGICQDTFLNFKPVDAEGPCYPTAFTYLNNSQTRKQYKSPYIHGLHYSVYPKERMLFTDFQQLIEELQNNITTVCDLRAEADALTINTNNDEEFLPPALKAEMPADLHMRYICDALCKYFRKTDNPNSATLAYFLYHHFAAEDMSLSDLFKLGDCSWTRTLTLAMENYEPPQALPFGQSVCAVVHEFLATIVPESIFESDMSRGGDDDVTPSLGEESEMVKNIHEQFQFQ